MTKSIAEVSEPVTPWCDSIAEAKKAFMDYLCLTGEPLNCNRSNIICESGIHFGKEQFRFSKKFFDRENDRLYNNIS